MKISQRGHPVIIYRLGSFLIVLLIIIITCYDIAGNQGPDSVNAAFNHEDFNFMMIRSFAFLGCTPNIDWKIEMTPVNFTAEVIIKFAKLLPDHVGQIYHLINNQPLQLRFDKL